MTLEAYIFFVLCTIVAVAEIVIFVTGHFEEQARDAAYSEDRADD